MPFKKILWPTDFSEPSYEALEVAVKMAETFHGELTLLHVIPPIPALTGPESPASFDVSRYQAELERTAEKMMDQVREKRIPKSVRTGRLVAQGSPPLEIARVAEEKDMDLIVIATRGESALKHVFFGSVADKVMRHSLIPVLIIPARRAKK
jgi:nucleotide-binding universal stress UspA family protein